jgi:HEAT repeat protein
VRRLAQANPFVVLPMTSSVMSSAPASRKARAARKLGHSGSQLVTRELLDLLGDPSPEVRKEAALALGRTRDSEAVAPLIERSGDVDAEMRRQAAWALGQIGSADATERLVELLADPYPHVRSAAALALGQVGGQAAGDALMALLADEGEQVEFASAATALGLLGRADAMRPILGRMVRTDQQVFRRQLAVAAGDLLGPAHTFYTYLDRETKVHGRRAIRSCRVVRRALPAALGHLVDPAREAYLAEEWGACARRLAELSGHVLARAGGEAGLAGEFLRWLGESADSLAGEAGFEACLLGLFALEQLAASLPRVDGA